MGKVLKGYSNVRLEPADDGFFILNYDEVYETTKPGETYSNRDYKPKNKIYKDDQAAEIIKEIRNLYSNKVGY